MISIKTSLVNPKYTAIILLLMLFGVTLAYAQYSTLGNIDAADRLVITEKAEVIKSVNITDTLEISERTELHTTFQDSK